MILLRFDGRSGARARLNARATRRSERARPLCGVREVTVVERFEVALDAIHRARRRSL